MKKILFATATAVLVLSSCSSEISESFETKYDSRTPLTVSTYVPGLTRQAAGDAAGIAGIDSLQSPIKGFWLNAATNDPKSPVMLDTALYKYDFEYQGWYNVISDEEVYWPMEPSTEVTFYGFYNAQNLEASIGNDMIDVLSGTIDPVDVDGATDLMAACTTTSLLANNGNGNVTLDFKHILAQVTCQIVPAFRSDAYQYVVGDVTIYAPNKKAYSFSAQGFVSSDSAKYSSYAVNEASVVDGAINLETTVTEQTPGDVIEETSQVGRTIMVTPGDCDIEITFEVNLVNGTEVVKRNLKTGFASFYAVAGKNNVLTITLSPEQVPLGVSATVSDWAEADNNIDTELEEGV